MASSDPRRDSREGDADDRSDDLHESGTSQGSGISGRLTERLRDVLEGDVDGDLLLEREDVVNGVLRWLRALDSQVIGACRADERLRPLPKLGLPTGSAVEDCLIAQLSQHFEASEVGMIARCLCVPLVSIRVGKTNKQGNLLCPTSTRGHLNLTLLPSSSMRVTFNGDNGCEERLALVYNNSESSDVILEEIPSDGSSRSFLLKLPGSRVLYFWCSEKSVLHGKELLAKMKDLLERRPSLSHLTGISDSRLESFASHLRAYIVGYSDTLMTANSSGALRDTVSRSNEADAWSQSSSVSKSWHRLVGHASKAHAFFQESLSPRPNSFKDGSTSRSLASLRGANRDKYRRRGENCSDVVTSKSLIVSEPGSAITSLPFSKPEDKKLSVANADTGLLNVVASLPLSSFSPLSFNIPSPTNRNLNPINSPYYCWCRPSPTVTQCTDKSLLPPTSFESLPLPPLSTLLSDVTSTVSLTSCAHPASAAELPKLGFSSLFPESLVRLPFPASSLVALPTTQQIPTFTPLMSDPIVHIPVIDVCSAGQGYLVSAGPAISSSLPPCLPKSGGCLIPQSESLVEKSARETLRLLMASTPMPTSNGLMNVLPAVFSSINENFESSSVNKGNGVVIDGEASLTNQNDDVDAVVNNVVSLNLSCSNGSNLSISDPSELNDEASKDRICISSKFDDSLSD